MTRKDYKIIAQALSDARPCQDVDASMMTATQIAAVSVWNNCVDCITAELARHNINFNRDKFYAACMGETED